MKTNDVIKVALLDDELLFLDGLKRIVSEAENIQVVLACGDGVAFFDQLSTLPELPDILLLDIRMKPMDGFAVAERLVSEYPDIRIIVLSSHYEQAFIGHMVRLGAAAFLPKNSTGELLHTAIVTVYQSGIYFTETDRLMLVSFMKNKPRESSMHPGNQLSEREIEVVRLICDEYTNHEIAEKLILSKRTVESHRQRILDKIGAKNTAGIVIYAIAYELYTPSFLLRSV